MPPAAAIPGTAPAPGDAIAGPADALTRLARTRDPAAWAWLLDRLGPALATVAARLRDDRASADDAAQEALLTLRDHAGSFRPRVDPDAEARRWIMRVAANAALNLRRARRRARGRDARAAATGESPAREGADMERDETARIVRDALGEIGEAERTAIVLHVLGGLGYDQVAAELRCPVGTAKTRVHRGLERLRRLLGPRQQALALAGLAALLARDAAAAETLPSTASTLLGAARAGSPPPPLIIGGTTMAAKLVIALAAVLAASTPLAVLAQSREAQPMTALSAPRADGTPALLAATASAAPTRIDGRLRKLVSPEFVDATVTEGVAWLAKEIGADCTVADAVARRRIDFQATDMTAGAALRWMADLARAHVVVADDGARVADGRVDRPAIELDFGRMLAPGVLPDDVRARLARRTDWEFQHTTVEDVESYLRLQKSVNLVLDPALKHDPNPDYTDRNHQTSYACVLDTFARTEGYALHWCDEAVAVTRASTLTSAVPEDWLERPRAIDLTGATVADVADFLRRRCEVEVVIDPGAGAGRAATLGVIDRSAMGLLDAAANAIGFRWAAAGPRVVLSPLDVHEALERRARVDVQFVLLPGAARAIERELGFPVVIARGMSSVVPFSYACDGKLGEALDGLARGQGVTWSVVDDHVEIGPAKP